MVAEGHADRRGSRLHALGDIGNRWLPQTTCALCQIFRRPPAAVATSRADYRK